MGISDYSGITSKRKKGQKVVSKAKTREERRKAEMRHLKPDKLLIKKNRKTAITKVINGELKLYFKKPDDIDYIGKYININHYMGANSYDVDLITKLFKRHVKKDKNGDVLIRGKGGTGWEVIKTGIKKKKK